MKQNLLIFALLFTLASCKNYNSPTEVVEQSMSYIQDEEWVNLADFLISGTDIPDDATPFEIERFNEMTPAKYAEQWKSIMCLDIRDKGGISSFKIADERINSSRNKAEVKVVITYGNGSVETEYIKCFRTIDNGNWIHRRFNL